LRRASFLFWARAVFKLMTMMCESWRDGFKAVGAEEA
jgi:hypothetical protein